MSDASPTMRGECTPARRAELAAGLAKTKRRIEVACAAVGRDPAQIHLIVVTKTWPVADVVALAELGVRHVGENKVADLAAKRDACPDLPLTWHFIGQIQSNKARQISRSADVVHAVDREKIVPLLAQGRAEADAALTCLVQVSLDDPPRPGRAGVHPDQALSLATAVVHAGGLSLRGVMGVAPPDGDPRVAFQRLQQVSHRVAREYPGATWISAGMSGDLEEAVAAGATHLRVGSAILGTRAVLR